MSIPTIEQFTLHLVESGLMTANELSDFCASRQIDIHHHDTSGLITQLSQAGRLTAYQAHVLCAEEPRPLVLNHYELLEPLGEGGMGQVFRARHRWMQREVALKTIIQQNRESARQRFQREVIAAARLVHPNVVTAYDAAEANGLYYLVMEYVDGMNLAQLVNRRGPLPLAEALHCVLQAADGLYHVHQAGIVHRDVKPSNLLVARDGTVKVLDLGLARLGKQRSEESTAGQVVGTVTFMSPEQGLDNHNVDQRSDIYSLGCTLYYLLTSSPLYRGQDHETLRAHREAPIPSLLDINPAWPHELDAIFNRMLAKTPTDRYSDLPTLVEDLRGLEHEPCVPIVPSIRREFSSDEDSHQTNAEGTDQATVENNATPNISSSDKLDTRTGTPRDATLLPALSELDAVRDFHATAIAESEDTQNHVPSPRLTCESLCDEAVSPTVRTPSPSDTASSSRRLLLASVLFFCVLTALASIWLSTAGFSPWTLVGILMALWAMCCLVPQAWLQLFDLSDRKAGFTSAGFSAIRRFFRFSNRSEIE